jgi:hypothetical protein
MRRVQLTLLVALSVAALGAAQPAGDLETVLARVGEKISDYYKRVQNVICIEKYTVQPIGRDYGPDGFARVTESELRVETDSNDGDGGGEAKIVRVLRKVNGRMPREKDKKDSGRCTDPNPLSPEPLSFLLPAHRAEYTFALVGMGKGKDRDSLLVDFKSIPTKSRPELIQSEKGLDDCFSAVGEIPTKGRVWINANTYDVTKVEEHLIGGPVDLRIADGLRRKKNLDQIAIERFDITLRFKRVVFHEPDEEMLLPESIDNLIAWRGGMQSSRRIQTFSEYRRFLTGGRVVK